MQAILTTEAMPNIIGMQIRLVLSRCVFSISKDVLYANVNESIPKRISPVRVIIRIRKMVSRRLSIVCSSRSMGFLIKVLVGPTLNVFSRAISLELKAVCSCSHQ